MNYTIKTIPAFSEQEIENQKIIDNFKNEVCELKKYIRRCNKEELKHSEIICHV